MNWYTVPLILMRKDLALFFEIMSKLPWFVDATCHVSVWWHDVILLLVIHCPNNKNDLVERLVLSNKTSILPSPSLKLTWPLKIGGGETILSFGFWPIFRGEVLVSGKCSSSNILHQAPYFAMRALGIQNFEQTFVVDVGRHAPWRQVKVMSFFSVGGVGMAQQKGNPSQLLKYTPQKTNICRPSKMMLGRRTIYFTFFGVLDGFLGEKSGRLGSQTRIFSYLKLLPRGSVAFGGGLEPLAIPMISHDDIPRCCWGDTPHLRPHNSPGTCSMPGNQLQKRLEAETMLLGSFKKGNQNI